MVEIFKTNVQEVNESKQIVQTLLEHFPLYNINFDLEDCDKILRIESFFIEIKNIKSILNSLGYQCELIPY